MQIKQFNGGISKRIDASLIEINEAVNYVNIDNTDLTLRGLKGTTALTIEARDYFYNFKNVWLSSYMPRDYVEYDNKLYYTEQNNIPQKSVDGTNIFNLGIAQPTESDAAITVGGIEYRTIVAEAVDPITGEDPLSASVLTLQYCYTYYNSADGTESAPSPLSNEVTVAAGKVVKLINIIRSTDPQVTDIRLYKVGTNITSFALFKTIPNNLTEARDAVKSTEVTTLLETFNYNQPLAGLRFLVQAYGILFAALGTKLYFTVIGKPNAWPTANFLLFESDITGILPTQDGIFVFTKSKAKLLVGTKITDFAIRPISDEQGCNSHKSCRMVRNTPVWSSLDGICQWSSGSIDVISKDKLGKVTLDIKNTCLFDETYYVLQTNGNLLAMDTRFGGIVFKDIDLEKSIVDIGAFNSVLYGIVEERVHKLFDGDLVPFRYLSPKYTEGFMTVSKGYNNVYIKAKGQLTISIVIDDEVVITKEYNLPVAKLIDLKVPEDKQFGTYIQFDIRGTGQVWEIEYKTIGRSNGR